MARDVNKLEAAKIKKLETPGRFKDGNGLTLIVRPSGSKSWIGLIYVNGKPREMGFGTYPEIGLAEAREAIKAAKALARQGIDPIAARNSTQMPLAEKGGPPIENGPAMTFGDVADAHLAAQSKLWASDKTLASWKNSLLNHCAPIRAIPVADIDVRHVLLVLKPIWDTHHEIARVTQHRIKGVIDRAIALGDRKNPENPADWETRLRFTLSPKRKLTRGHHASLPFSEAPAFIGCLRGERSGVGALALEFTILEAVRSGEAIYARWREFDFKEETWKIPLGRVKARKVFRLMRLDGHTVPLSKDAITILSQLQRKQFGSGEIDSDAYVFPGEVRGKPLSNGAMERTLDRMKVDVTMHGFRSSFRNWASRERVFVPDVHRHIPAYSWEACEASLGHVAGDAAQRAYLSERCLEERREILADWAAFLAGRPRERLAGALARLAA